MSLKLLQSNSMLTLLLIAGAGGYMLGVYLPAARTNRALQAELLLKQQSALGAAATASQIRQVEQELQEARDYVKRWQTKVPRLRELPAVYGEISHATVTSSAALSELEPRPATTYDRMAQVPVAVACRGTHSQLLALLARIERLPRLIWVDELRLARAAADTQAMECELVLSVFGDNSENSDYANSAGNR
jgi:Tfp pilus assembly protein PilO